MAAPAPDRLVLPAAVRREILAHVSANPDLECCGLLVGQGGAGREGQAITVVRIAPAANIATAPSQRFEINPQEQFDLLRALRGTDYRVVGHYHSHPHGPAMPSAHDLSMAHDPEAVWLIISAATEEMAAFWCPDQAAGFLPLRMTDKV